MGYFNCPSCSKRLKVPDSDKPVTLRCPSCKAVFDGLSGNARPADDEIPEKKQPSQEEDHDEELFHSDAGADSADILSKADEAMLRKFDSGTGLLELTRETYQETLVGQQGNSSISPGESEGPLSPAQREAERQFQIVDTALTLANKLVLTHKTELKRTRRNALIAWLTVVAMSAGVVVSLLWGTMKSDSANVERARADSISDQLSAAESSLNEEKGKMAKLAEELETVRGDLRKLAEELETVQGDFRKLAEELETVRGDLRKLRDDLDVVRAWLAPAIRRSDGLRREDRRPRSGS